jgi:alpha-tubulin suppressor-like RCC1 family protein
MPRIGCTRFRFLPVLALVVAALGCREDTQSPTTPEPGPALAIRPAHRLSFRQVSAGQSHTCGVAPAGQAYCWGENFFGQLGDGTGTDHLTPVRVAGGLRFRQVSTGTSHSCGVTVNNRLYCWGANTTAEVGDGTTTPRLMPVPVAGGLRFRQVDAGNGNTCGVTLDHLAYCWGDNGAGKLGDGTTTARLTPVPVVGGLRFREVSTAVGHTCGVTLDHRAYCWGNNSNGTLGVGPPENLRLTPVPVAGGLRFRQVGVGFSHTCGVTLGNVAYCWGANIFGEVGDGTTFSTRLTPVRVAGGLRFRRVDAVGEFHTCGLTLGKRAYCWGLNDNGQLGDGTTINRLTPVATAGGLLIRQVSAYFNHSCGVTLGNVAYCWGSNENGQLGDGTTINRLTPVRVAGQALDGGDDQGSVDESDSDVEQE